MKKSTIAVCLSAILGFTLFALCGCDTDAAEKYTLTVTGRSDFIVEPLNESYAAGETVTVKTGILYDADITATLNGAPLWYTPVEEGGNSYWEFTFIMPKKNSTLDLKVVNGFLPAPIEIESTVAYYNLALTSDREIAGFKMNAYIESVTTWNQISLLIHDFPKTYDEEFFRSKSLLVVFGEKGHGGGGTLESATVTLTGGVLNINLQEKVVTGDYSVPDVMTEWVVVLEIENNLLIHDITVTTNI